MKHNHAECEICGTKNRYNRPVDGLNLCQPCHYKLVLRGEANAAGIIDAIKRKEQENGRNTWSCGANK